MNRSTVAVRGAMTLGMIGALGCLGGPVQLYDGPRRAQETVASLSNGALGTRLYAIGPHRAVGSHFLIEPGQYEVWIRVRMRETAGDARYTIWTYCQYQLDARAGRSYSTADHSAITRSTVAGKYGELAAVIEDDEGLVAARSLYCQGDRPQRDDVIR